MSRYRYTAEEKGKAVAQQSESNEPQPHKRTLPSVHPPTLREEDFYSHQQRRVNLPHKQKAALDFNKRLDRHGRPFGERLALLPVRGRPISNKIVPHSDLLASETHTADRQGEDHHGIPRERTRNSARRSPHQVWRAKTPRNALRPNQSRECPREHTPVERQSVPSREEVMNDLLEATLNYTNCPDPVESAARRQRVHDEDAGLMEETATRIIAAAQRNLDRNEVNTALNQAVTPPPPPAPQRLPPASTSRRSINRSTRNRRAAASPRLHFGASASKRILSHTRSSQRLGFPHASPILPINRRRNNEQAAPPLPRGISGPVGLKQNQQLQESNCEMEQGLLYQ
ncbi:hypothetical protein HID58_013432 [Brassica napus]|uniref:Uncharacterized protein n=1 Tax=Brassica napus TaxID=3708 RepID=A0ABQ8E3X5_BRANA|nr:hypothetical protein HID58_013432 [Brassica napus]